MLNGKGYYIWQIARTEGGNATAIADLAQAARLKHVLIKIADGDKPMNVTSSGYDMVAPLVQVLKSRGIEVWGWHYVYGYEPTKEAQVAIQRIQATGVVGYAVDAEAEYKEPGKDRAALTFMQALRNALPAFPVALSTYRYPSFHPSFPFQQFLSLSDYAMPQVYWAHAHDPRAQLTRTISEYRTLTSLPIIATGAAYSEGGWQPATSEVVDFMDAAEDFNLGGVNFWEWYTARRIPNMWETIAGYDWPEPPAGAFLFRRQVQADVPVLNVRSGPSTSYSKVGSLKAGTRVTVFEVQGVWVRISPDRSLWVSSDYLDWLP